MKIVHISRFKRNDVMGLQLGGVEQFALYLQRVVPEMKLISFSDLPGWLTHREKSGFEQARLLNRWLLDEGLVDEETTVVTDGYWGLELEGRVARLVSVVHGSLYGRFIQSQIYPWGGVVDMREIEAQLYMWKHSEPVCVAQESKVELEKAGLECAAVIYHGLPLDVFKPSGKGKIWMHAATSARKGLDLIPLIARESQQAIEPMNEYTGVGHRKAVRLNQAKALVAPTRHEGNAYVLIEALACGVPLITYQTGLACEMDRRCGEITDDLSVANFTRLINGFGKYAPREWAEEMCDFDAFGAEWREFLEV